MYTPQVILAAAGSSSSGASVAKAKIRVKLYTLEGQAASSYQGAQLDCELRLGCAKQGGKLEGPQRKFAVRVSSQSHSGGYGLEVAPGTAPLNFDLPGPGPLSRNALRISLKLSQASKGNKAGYSDSRGAKPIGELCCSIPVRSNATRPLGDGFAPLAIRIDVCWEGLDNLALLTLAEHVGKYMLEASTQQKWQELAHLTQLPQSDWGRAPLERVKALTLGQVNEDKRSALRLCIVRASDLTGPTTALKALLDARSDPHTVAGDGASPLTAALQAGAPFAPILIEFIANAQPDVSRAVGLGMSPPWILGPVDWEALRALRCFDLVVVAAEHPNLPAVASSGDRFDPWKKSNPDMGKSRALTDTLCHAVQRRLLNMSSRVLAAMAPLHGQASAAEALLLDQMFRLASADSRWFAVAQAQLARGAALGTKAWRGGHRVLLQLADLAAKGQPRAQEALLEAALGKEWDRSCDEPRLLFPDRAAECAVCFEPLYQNDPCYFIDKSKKRACVHYVCGDCVPTCLPNKECPMCRNEILTAVQLPSLEADPRGWFRAASCGDGFLEQSQLCHAMAASLPICEENLLSAMESDSGPFKTGWDKNFDGRITEEEFFDPDNGLFAWILAHLQELHRAVKRKSTTGNSTVPDVRSDAGGWFDFFDDKSIGSLTFAEVLRGMCASLKISALEDRRHSARQEIADIWRAAGIQTQSVTKNKFLLPGGLASMLGDALERAKVPVGEVSIAAMPESPPRKLTFDPPVSQSMSKLQLDGPPVQSHGSVGSRHSRSSRNGDRGDRELMNQQQAAFATLAAQGSAATESDTKLATLLAMGFPVEDGKRALARANGNVELAVGILLGTADAGQGSSRRGARH